MTSPYAPVVGASIYVLGDVLLLSAEPDEKRFSILRRDDVDDTIGAMLPFSTTRLAIGAALPVLATPLMFSVASTRREHLRAGGAPNWVSTGTWASYIVGVGLSPIIHGSFYPFARRYQIAQGEADKPENAAAAERALDQAKSLGKVLEKLYFPYFAAMATATLLEGGAILAGKSRLPRWSAGLVTPALPVAVATAVTANGTGRHPAWRSLQGAGFSLGEVLAFGAGAVIGKRKTK